MYWKKIRRISVKYKPYYNNADIIVWTRLYFDMSIQAYIIQYSSIYIPTY